MFRTVSIPIILPPDALELLKTAQVIFNEYAAWAFENKTWSKKRAHAELYRVHRGKYPDFPSNLVQTVRDTALEACKGEKNQRPVKKKTLSLRYDKRTLTLKGQTLSLSGFGKRMKVKIEIPAYFKRDHWRLKGGTLVYQKGQFHMKLTYEAPTPAKTVNVPADLVVGIDRGIYNLAVTSNGAVYGGKKLRSSQRKNLYNRRMLQAKGTPSSKHRLRQQSGREARFSRDVNHCISKQIVNSPAEIFVIEDLTGIRKTRRGKVINKWLGSWPFHQLEMFLDYKAEELGKTVVKVDPAYTSQTCSCCGHVDKRNRQGPRFDCVSCGYKNDADRNAALNIKFKFLMSPAEAFPVGKKPKKKVDGGQGSVNSPYVPVEVIQSGTNLELETLGS